MKTKLLRRIRRRYEIYKVTKGDDLSAIYDWRVVNAKGDVVYLICRAYRVFGIAIFLDKYSAHTSLQEAKDFILKSTINEYKKKRTTIYTKVWYNEG